MTTRAQRGKRIDFGFGLLWVAAWIFAASTSNPGRGREPKPEPEAGKGKEEPAAAAAPSLFPEGYRNHEALTAALRALEARAGDRLKLESLTKTARGRDVWLVRVAKDEAPRPALLIVGTLEGDHLVGSEVAIGLIERLVGDDESARAILDRVAVYVAPRLNPDGAERIFERPTMAARTNMRPVDRDKDGQIDEDGPEDLDGDGLIAAMLRPDPEKGSVVFDKDDPRIVRAGDRSKDDGEFYVELAEGIDNDGDGEINEDPPGGVNLNRNWPHRWTEFDPETGFSATSEPETRALIRFAYDHPELVAVWNFGLHDNLRAEPKKPESTLDEADLPLFAELARIYAKVTELPRPTPTPTPSSDEKGTEAEPGTEPQPGAEPESGAEGEAKKDGNEGDKAKPATWKPVGDGPVWGATSDGSIGEWAYHQFGVFGLASRLWTSPDIPPDLGKAPDHGDARWLFWNDKVMGGRAFANWTAMDHPTLGPIKIGGWRPGVRLNPPAEVVPAIVETQWAFLGELASRVPRLEFADVKAEGMGSGVWRIEASIENVGSWPTALAQGVRTRQSAPILLRLRLPEGATLLGGSALERIPTLNPKGPRRTFRWLIHAPGADSIRLEAIHAKSGGAVRDVELK